MPTPKEVLESYKEYLKILYPNYVSRFNGRTSAQPESATAEAIIFSLLCSLNLDPEVFDIEGGPDFHCKNSDCIVEVMSIKKDTLEKEKYSGVPADISKQKGGSYSYITHPLRLRANQKIYQVKGYPGPRILVICSEHYFSDTLLGPEQAQSLLSSEPKIAFSLMSTNSNVENVTDLEDSVFFELKNGSIKPKRESLSAILLGAIYSDHLKLCGLLHPKPEIELPYREVLPEVPFVYLSQWPPGDYLSIKWTTGTPQAHDFYHKIVELPRKVGN